MDLHGRPRTGGASRGRVCHRAAHRQPYAPRARYPAGRAATPRHGHQRSGLPRLTVRPTVGAPDRRGRRRPRGNGNQKLPGRGVVARRRSATSRLDIVCGGPSLWPLAYDEARPHVARFRRLCRLPRSAGRHPYLRWSVALVCGCLAGRWPRLFRPVPAFHEHHGAHHPGRIGVGCAPRDRTLGLAGNGGRATRPQCQRITLARNRQHRDPTGSARLQRHANTSAQPDRKPHAPACGHLARPAHASRLFCACAPKRSKTQARGTRCCPPSPRWTL